jgi:Uncharacterised nucleotidyltransferase
MMHPFIQLARQLSPDTHPPGSAEPDWTLLLQLANQHKCTPLWYVRLRERRLLEQLPAELREYLAQLHAANTDRNRLLRAALEDIVAWCGAAGIPMMLLKGAAVLADDLYGDPGARLMGDLDLLVPAERVHEVQQLLLGRGYAVCPPEEEKHIYRLPTDAAYHLDPLCRPGSGIVVEIHHRLMGRQGGRALPVSQVWAERIPAPGFSGAVYLPSTSWRLLHNALHALLPYAEFIRSQVLLCNLAEAATLLKATGTSLDWQPWTSAARQHSLKSELRGYAQLLRELMGATLPECWTRLSGGNSSLRRLTLGAGQTVSPLSQQERIGLRLYYLRHLPGYAWRNVCYAPGWWRLPERLGCLLTRGFRRRARSKLRF